MTPAQKAHSQPLPVGLFSLFWDLPLIRVLISPVGDAGPTICNGNLLTCGSKVSRKNLPDNCLFLNLCISRPLVDPGQFSRWRERYIVPLKEKKLFAKNKNHGFQKRAREMLAGAYQYTEPVQIVESAKQKKQREFKEYTAAMANELGRRATSLDLKFLAHLLFVAASEATDVTPV